MGPRSWRPGTAYVEVLRGSTTKNLPQGASKTEINYKLEGLYFIIIMNKFRKIMSFLTLFR